MAALLGAWRGPKPPIYHIRHDSIEPTSHYRPGQPGNEFKLEAQPLSRETIIPKRANSAFIGTDLEARLRAAQQTTLVVAGVITDNSVEATVRMAGKLGSMCSSWRMLASRLDRQIGVADSGPLKKYTL